MVLEARNQTWKNTRIIWNINRFGNLVHLAYNPKVEGSNPSPVTNFFHLIST